MHMENRQSMQQHVGFRDAPQIHQRFGVGGKIAVGDHGALGTPRGAGRIEEPCEIVGFAFHRIVAVIHLRRHGGERALAMGIEVHHREDLVAVAQGPHRRLAGGIAHDELGAGIAHEVIGLGVRIGGVQGLIDAARFQHRQVEHHVGERFFHLHGDPVAGLDAQCRQRVGIAGHFGQERRVIQRRRTIGGADCGSGAGVAEALFEFAIEIFTRHY